MKRNPVNLTRSVFLWAMLGIIGGLFAATYWIFLSYLMVGFEDFSGLSLPILRTVFKQREYHKIGRREG